MRILRHARWALACLLAGAAPLPAPDIALADLERASGGRLGAAMIDARGRTLLAARADERFALCSTFKFLLAGMVLDGHHRGRWSLDETLPLAASDMVFNSPVSQARLAGGRIGIADAARAAVTTSDNTAANLLLARVGGPAALTAWLREHGDTVTRLDRIEPVVNQNAVGDPRDTTTMAAMTRTTAGLMLGDWLRPAERTTLRDWMIASETGHKRLRAGLPAGWVVGDKTGTCGGSGSASYNDVAYVQPSLRHPGYILAVYLDRPRTDSDGANATIASVARLAARVAGESRHSAATPAR